MKTRKVVAIAVTQDYLVATKYALKVMGVYHDSKDHLHWYTYDVLLRSDNLDRIVQEAYKMANKMKVPYLSGIKSTEVVSDKHIKNLQRRLLI